MPFEFRPLGIPGLILATPRAFGDTRGFFMETYRRAEFERAGIAGEFTQDNHARTGAKGTLRGLHFQRPPHAQAKLVRCVRGSVWDVAVDIRPGSTTFGKWDAVELSEENRAVIYVPKGFAHGYLTLTDDTEVLYKVDADYAPSAEGGIRWDDKEIAIGWPVTSPILSDRDKAWAGIKG